MSAQHFFVHGRYLGERPIPPFKTSQTFGPMETQNWVYFCRKCGDIWARFLIDTATETNLAQHYCAKHGDGRLEGHSRFEWWETEFASDWPLDAM